MNTLEYINHYCRFENGDKIEHKEDKSVKTIKSYLPEYHQAECEDGSVVFCQDYFVVPGDLVNFCVKKFGFKSQGDCLSHRSILYAMPQTVDEIVEVLVERKMRGQL